MGYLVESLAPGEAVVAHFDLHWTAKWRLIVFLLLAIPTFGIALLAAIYEWIRLRSIEQGVTNRRVVRKTGIVSRETEELRLEDRHLGGALLRVLGEFDVTTELFPPGRLNPVGVSHAAAFALACARWHIASLPALQAYAWAWAENQVIAAVKLVPLGQSAGQRVLYGLGSRLVALAGAATAIPDCDLGISTSLAAVASGKHETQYTRLFRS
jgi:urease accessory protein UreF